MSRAVHTIVNSKQSAMKQSIVTPTKDFTKRIKTDSDATSNEEVLESMDYFNMLSPEILCHILRYLPLNDVMKLESLCGKLHVACTLHLRLITKIDFTEGEIYGWMPLSLNDCTFKKLLSRCPNLISVYGLHPCFLILSRRKLHHDCLSVQGIIEGLSICTQLEYVETCDIFLLEALLIQLPHITVGDFRNRNGHLPLPMSHRLTLVRTNKLTSLQLSGVTVSHIPQMDNLKHLHLKFVNLSDPHPFVDFLCPSLRSFVMSHCAGPRCALQYVPLVVGLASAPKLSRMELVQVPFFGALFQRVVEDSWRNSGFRSLAKITFGACRYAQEMDIGYLLAASSIRLQELSLQPSLTTDTFFSSLNWANIEFPRLQSINLGYVDFFPELVAWTYADLWFAQAVVDIEEIPSIMTDFGMNEAGRVFENCRNLSIYNAPHLHFPTNWFSPPLNSWQHLNYVHIRRCHAILLQDFCMFVSSLRRLEYLSIVEMFREPSRGCSRVGLSVGTGLGVSSTLHTVSLTAPANQQPANNAAPNDAANAADDNLSEEEEDTTNPQNQLNEQNESEEDQVMEYELLRPSYEDAMNYPETEDDFYDDKFTGESKRMFDGASTSNHAVSNVKYIEKGKGKCMKGKGKSLQGKKKGIAKNSTHKQQVNKSCQATSKEIIETAKKAKEDGDKCAGVSDQSLHSSTSSNQSKKSGSSSGSSGDQPEPNSKPNQVETKKVSQLDKRQREDIEQSQHRSQLRIQIRSKTLCLPPAGRSSLPLGGVPQLRRKPPTVDKCTSTSDPIIIEDDDDDHIQQILTIKSKSLVQLSLRTVGVTDLVIEDCPRLRILSVLSCRVLKKVELRRLPRLIRTSFLQCPRLPCDDAMDELCMQPPEKSRLLFLRPVGTNYSIFDMEKCLLNNPVYDYHLCIIHDYSPDPFATLYNRNRVASWLDLLETINVELLRFMELPEPHGSNHYPWGRQIHRMYGLNANGSRWEILTDVPWLPTLASAPDLPSTEVKPDDTKPGVYCPRAKGHTNTDVLLEQLADDFAGAKESRYKIYSHTVVIYVNMCDLVGVKGPDFLV